MNHRKTVAAVVALLLVAGVASARNMHCAGGIQYVVQGLKDKERGNTEDYSREMNKAVDQLVACANEDPADLEALGYLGWAYAELDSSGPAGMWFQKSIDGLSAKGDKKKLEIVLNNRESYWARAYNEGIKRIGDAQNAWPEYTKTPLTPRICAAPNDNWGEPVASKTRSICPMVSRTAAKSWVAAER